MSEAGLEVRQASWREGLVPAHWQMELGGEPLAGRAMGRGVSRSSCGLRKSAVSLLLGRDTANTTNKLLGLRRPSTGPTGC